MAAVLGKSPQLQALVQRKTGLQKPGVHQLTRGGQPVIQRKTEVEYKTQPVAYTDAHGTQQVEHVGKVADAFIDPADPITGTAPNASKQQPQMYNRLKTTYGQGFIRGHLLNDNLGGVGEVYNLFPITSSANSEHKITAEGHLKKYIRTEMDAKAKNLGGPYFVRYRVTAVPANGADLTSNAKAQFLCEMVAAHSLQAMGKSETWTVFSEPKAQPKALGGRSLKDDYGNKGLGNFGSSQSGEHANTLASRMRSTVDGWRGDQNFKFATGGLSAHLDLVALKEQYLQNIEDALDKSPVYEEILFDALDRAKDLFATAHDVPSLDKAKQQLEGEVRAWECGQKKQEFLGGLRSALIAVNIPDQDKHNVYNTVEKQIAPVTDLTAFEQMAGALVTQVTQHVQQLIQKQSGN